MMAQIQDNAHYGSLNRADMYYESTLNKNGMKLAQAWDHPISTAKDDLYFENSLNKKQMIA